MYLLFIILLYSKAFSVQPLDGMFYLFLILVFNTKHVSVLKTLRGCRAEHEENFSRNLSIF
jgi:hypothetical protein